MSKYTTEVRYICETYAGYQHSEGLGRVNDIIASAEPKVFDFTYPIWDESKRHEFQQKILRNFYTREIAFETVGLWKLKLQNRLIQIMPYYNRLYKALDDDFNLLHDVDLHRELTSNGTLDETRNGTRDENETTQDGLNATETRNFHKSESGTVDTDIVHGKDSLRKLSETPQGGLQGLLDGTYLTAAEQNKDSGTDTTNEERNLGYTDSGTITHKDDRNVSRGTNETTKDITDQDTTRHDTEHTWGKSPGVSFSQMIQEYMDKVQALDQVVMLELNDLFMLIY